ncbi:precorrin-6Y C5,15-methyltransferase (decarboxylating) subunit CbiT [Thermodesulfitimonas sp.]
MVDFPYVTPGIPDAAFLRDGVPLTREEVRVVVLAKLRLPLAGVFWDVGAGTGSVAVEAARLMPEGKVFAVEAEKERAALIRANRERFGLTNLTVVAGEAPAALGALPRPDRVFVGGSGGRLPEILAYLRELLPAGGRLVVSAVTLETLETAAGMLRWLGWQGEIISLSVVRGEKVGGRTLLRGGNPIFLVVAAREQA